ncbi:ABC transporter G family member 23 [Apostasia shenzhenica]|uniref:ABC transporter G family member 23 n=1 Tax=Apostasia shenzhenica TaxID=1088818 RepID=A0A2I0B3A4_9ASPA|nr:ABC transporter G family member 23 [Apostasia shenzhenica]
MQFRYLYSKYHGRNKPVEILKSVSFAARSSEILAIVGPSGAGKSTLLRIISGRVRRSDFNPQSISFNGAPATSPDRLRRICGFVTQDDNLLPLLTVKETLMFSARFRLRGMSDKERSEKVGRLMQELSLEHVADSFVGDEENRGISGGERKRVAIGVDVMHDPPVLLLDEPTSSLDSSSALQVIELLASMARTRRQILILTIHQPSYRILKHIASYLLLSGGRAAHFGEIASLSWRYWKIMHRTKQLLMARAAQAIVGSLGLGSVYLRLKENEAGVAERLGFFAFSLSFLLSSTVEALPIFLQERSVLMRDSSRRVYRLSSYMIANAAVTLPFLLAVALLFAVPAYWLVGLNQSPAAFAFFALVVWLILLMASSLVLFLSAVSADFVMGNYLICAFLGVFFLFSGYFIEKESIPKYWIFMYYASLYRYPLEALLINEYWSERGRCFSWWGDGGAQCSLTGGDVLKSRGLERDDRWVNVGIMCAFCLIYRVLSWAVLAWKASRTML